MDDVLMKLDEDSDDFDGYLDEDIYSRGSESDGDEDNSGNVSDGHMSVDSGNDGNSDGHMSVDGGNSNVRAMMEVHSSRELKVVEE